MKFWERREVGPIKAVHPETKKPITVYPQKDARIGSDLDEELRRLPGVLSWWIALRDEAERLRDQAQHLEHLVNEDLYEEFKKNNPKATETALKMMIKRDSQMRDAFRNRMEAEHMHRRLKGAVEAISEKRWSLMGLTKTAAMERGAKDNA